MVAIPEGYESLLKRPLYGHPADKSDRVIQVVRPTALRKQ